MSVVPGARAESQQLVPDAVELGVRDLRVVENVVAVEVVVDESRSSAIRFASLGGFFVFVLEDIEQIFRLVHDDVRARLDQPLFRVRPPHDTPTVNVPAALPAPTSNGESPTNAARAPFEFRRSSARSTGSGCGLCRSVSPDVTTTSKKRSIGRTAKARSTVRRRFAVTMPSLRPCDDSSPKRPSTPGKACKSAKRLVVRAVDAHELLHSVGRERLHLLADVHAADERGELRPGSRA